jgi:NAD(P) transhydrogenase subunit alpha
MTPLTVGVMRETDRDEQRVALTPGDAAALSQSGHAVLVTAGAGAAAHFSDEAYAAAGAQVLPAADVWSRADVLVCVRPPDAASAASTPGPQPGQIVLGLLGLASAPAVLSWLASTGTTVVSFDGLPRTLSRAQSMDALTSQATVAGYKAVLVAAAAFGGLMPMLMTAAGTTRPARVLVLGAGVAGLQAIGTARRLGAVVRAYDVRPAAREEIASMGAAVVDPGREFNGATADGYARDLTGEERRMLPDALATHVAHADIVIATAQVPGRIPPLLVTDGAVKAMRPGSVVVDMAAGPLGGNVAGSRPRHTLTTDNGVIVIGADNLAASVPTAASTAYSRNVVALLRHLLADGRLREDPGDPIERGVVVARDGRITAPTTDPQEPKAEVQ